MSRKRTLSNQGCQLFNIALINHQPNHCLKNIFYTLFSSDFDDRLEESIIKFRNSSYKLYSYLNEKDKHLIPIYFDNALVNLIYLILTNDNNVNNIKQIRKNLNFYYTLADKSSKTNDHNTAILIKAAIDNTVVKRLNIKLTKKQIKIKKEFDKKYGTFMNCNSAHLESILNNSDNNFIPSIAILLMHYNKTKEYYKCYNKLGKLPEKLKDKNKQLKKIVKEYYEQYKDCNIDLQDLYIKDPTNLDFMENLNESSHTINLFKISQLIK